MGLKNRNIIWLTSKDFHKKIKKTSGFAIVECFNNSEGPFIIMEPVIKKLKDKYGRNLTHFRINIHKETAIRDHFRLMNDISYLIFQDGILINQFSGLIPFYELMQLLEACITNKQK